MADEKKEQAPKPQVQPAARTVESPPEPERKLDETVPGGRYLVGNKLVDAEGQPVKE